MNKLSRCIAAAILLLAGAAQAQSAWPTKPIRIIVPYPAGGATDWMARTIGERLSKTLGQPIIVDNRPGASGQIGADAVAKAAPDGHTLLMTITDSQINNVALFKKLPYDPTKDFTFISQIVWSPAIVNANPDIPVKTMQEFVKYAKDNAAKASYGSWGAGGLGHLAGETLNQQIGAQMVHVQQRGEAPVINDLLTKATTIGFSSIGTARPHVEAGKITPLAVMGKQRSPALPNVPTFAELGFKDPLFETSIWLGLLGPAKLPTDVTQRLYQEVKAIISQPDVAKQITERGLVSIGSSPEEFERSFRSEFELITRRIRDFSIEPQ